MLYLIKEKNVWFSKKNISLAKTEPRTPFYLKFFHFSFLNVLKLLYFYLSLSTFGSHRCKKQKRENSPHLVIYGSLYGLTNRRKK